MAVKSRDLGTDADPLETGFVDEAAVARWGVWFVRALALGLVVYTTFGSFVPFAGGWTALREAWGQGWWEYLTSQRFGVALAVAVVFQGLLMWGQWGTKTQLVWWWRRWRWAVRTGRHAAAEYALQRVLGWLLLYGVLLVVSSGPSTYTYTTWVRPLIESFLMWGAILIFLISVVGDMIPEWVLVFRSAHADEGQEAQEEG